MQSNLIESEVNFFYFRQFHSFEYKYNLKIEILEKICN
jgi:hypothetical protein